MTVESCLEVNGKLEVVFVYRTPIKGMIMVHRLPVHITLGKSKEGHSIIHIRTPEDHFYYNLIRKHILLCFV